MFGVRDELECETMGDSLALKRSEARTRYARARARARDISPSSSVASDDSTHQPDLPRPPHRAAEDARRTRGAGWQRRVTERPTDRRRVGRGG